MKPTVPLLEKVAASEVLSVTLTVWVFKVKVRVYSLNLSLKDTKDTDSNYCCCSSSYVFFQLKILHMVRAKGVVIRLSEYTVNETIDRLQRYIQKNGGNIYARINQQAEVNNVGQDLCPLQFILFGNPRREGHLMAQNPLVALDLPLKAICWEDDEKRVWIAYNDTGYLEDRFSLDHIPNSPFSLDDLMEKLFKTSPW